jgi:hypothetical protein
LFTVVCVSHRPDVRERWLLPSLRAQPADLYELRVVDSRADPVASCAAGLNQGAAGARGKYLMFVHHDVAWDSPTFLADLAAQLDRVPDLGIAGVVGATARDRWPNRQFVNAVLAGEPPGELVGEPLAETRAAQTVDELMLIVPAEQFRADPFDAATCDDWHLYGVDYSLSAAARGLAVVVLPFVVRHQSPGDVNRGYYRTLDKVRRKHRGRVRRICTTIDTWNTGGPDGIQPLVHRYHWVNGWCRGLILRVVYALPRAALPPSLRPRRDQWWRWRRAAQAAAASQR